jgi:hypothetical protein
LRGGRGEGGEVFVFITVIIHYSLSIEEKRKDDFVNGFGSERGKRGGRCFRLYVYMACIGFEENVVFLSNWGLCMGE